MYILRKCNKKLLRECQQVELMHTYAHTHVQALMHTLYMCTAYLFSRKSLGVTGVSMKDVYSNSDLPHLTTRLHHLCECCYGNGFILKQEVLNQHLTCSVNAGNMLDEGRAISWNQWYAFTQ